MEELSGQLNAILSNPQMMQTIASMAQSLGQQSAPPQEEPQNVPSLPNLDPGMLRALGSMAGSGTIDDQQRSLLNALGPYLSRDRVDKLEKAMRAAKMARMASMFLGSGGLQLLTGR